MISIFFMSGVFGFNDSTLPIDSYILTRTQVSLELRNH